MHYSIGGHNISENNIGRCGVGFAFHFLFAINLSTNWAAPSLPLLTPPFPLWQKNAAANGKPRKILAKMAAMERSHCILFK